MMHRRMSLICIIFLILVGSLAPAADAAVYYLSPDGDDDAAGTETDPWQTIGFGRQQLAPGDTLHLLPGEYVESNTITGLNGTEAAPITIEGEPGVLVTATGRDAFLFWTNCQWVILDGLEITGGSRAGVIIAECADIIIRNCLIRDNRKWQIQSVLSDRLTVENCELTGAVLEHGVYFSTTDHPTVRNCHIHHNSGNGIHMNGDLSEGGDGIITGPVIVGNVIHHNGESGGAGINMDGGEDAFIANNLLYDNRAGGMNSYSIDSARGGRRNRYIHNTVYFEPGVGRYALQLYAGSTDAEVKNNILISDDQALEVDAASLPGLDSDHNVFYHHGGLDPIYSSGWKSLVEWRTMTGLDEHSVQGMPEFADLAGRDFHLVADSIAVDAGVFMADVPEDLDGVARPRGGAADIGTYEFHRKGDFDDDGDVDFWDFMEFVDVYGFTEQDPEWSGDSVIADFDDDDNVDFWDFMDFVDVYGTTYAASPGS